MATGGLITCTDLEALSGLLARLRKEGLAFHASEPFSLIGQKQVSVIFSAEKDVLERICTIANFQPDYQI